MKAKDQKLSGPRSCCFSSPRPLWRGELQVSFQHLEFNFIQLVVYPGRIAAQRQGD